MRDSAPAPAPAPVPAPVPRGRSQQRRRAHALRDRLPAGRHLRPHVWRTRHAGMLWLLWPHVPVISVFALYRGSSVLHALADAVPVAALAVVAGWQRAGQRLRSVAAALGLVVASSVLVHVAEGRTEAHFHFFVVLAFLSLYQSWSPFLVALGYVIVQHSAVGLLDPDSVYDHAAAWRSPLVWAALHGGFVLAASVANMLAWRLTEHEALHDDLTGLGNRAALLEKLRAHVERDGGAAVLFLDLDNFKEANDGFGHDVGDALLVVVGERIRAAVGGDDVVARLGGDEFAVVLVGVPEEQAVRVAERVRAAVSVPVRVDGRRLVPAVSIGVATVGRSASDLLRNADLAMYAAKRAGGGRVTPFVPAMHGDVLERALLEAELRTAVAVGELAVHFQPIVALGTGRTVGAEALVRWAHPQRGLVPPDQFIPLAEKSGLISAIGTHVLGVACRQAGRWSAAHPDQPLQVSVNVSSSQLVEPGMLDTVVAALAAAAIEPELLCLEITESTVIEEFDAVLPVLAALRAVGVRLALDDFGTGYSSLSYLHRLPVDSVKIDRSFVTDVDAAADGGIAQAITQLSHSFGLTVTAEGVETDAEVAALRRLGVDRVQGYRFGAPVAAEDFVPPQVPAPRLAADDAPRTARHRPA